MRPSPLAALLVGLVGCTVTVTREPIVARPRPATPILPSAAPVERAPVPPEPVVVDPEAARALFLHYPKAAAPLASKDPPKITVLALEGTARSEARGLRPDGDPLTATLEEGQRASRPLTLSPGDCVTVVAHGGLGVMEVDAFILGPPADRTAPDARPAILAQDGKNGPVAVIGGQSGCFSFGGAAKIDAELSVQARKGAGPVVVRVFRAAAPGAPPAPAGDGAVAPTSTPR
jgi:hypothetical protein